MTVLNFYHLKKGEWPAEAVYIGRPNPRLGLAGSPFANPFKKVDGIRSRDEAVAAYQDHLWQGLQKGLFSEAQLLELEHKDLVCFCAPQRCHGHVLERAVAWAVRRRDTGLTGTSIAPMRSPVPKPR